MLMKSDRYLTRRGVLVRRSFNTDSRVYSRRKKIGIIIQQQDQSEENDFCCQRTATEMTQVLLHVNQMWGRLLWQKLHIIFGWLVDVLLSFIKYQESCCGGEGKMRLVCKSCLWVEWNTHCDATEVMYGNCNIIWLYVWRHWLQICSILHVNLFSSSNKVYQRISWILKYQINNTENSVGSYRHRC